jgi:hypothetical protein
VSPSADRLRCAAAGLLCTLILALAGVLCAQAWSAFSAQLGHGSATAASAWDPTAAAATRTGVTACSVAWTPVAATPAGLSYDVLGSGGTVLAAGLTSSPVSVSVPVGAITPVVRAHLGSWISAAGTPVPTACRGFPDAPSGVIATASDGRIDVTWTAPAGNGGTLATTTVTAALAAPARPSRRPPGARSPG